MTSDLSAEKTTVLATYPTRRDAEMAMDRLEAEHIQAFITADDAGGMHPELQWTQGVKLVVLSGRAEEASAVLGDAGMLPQSGPADAEMPHEPSGEERSDNLTFSTDGWASTTAWGYTVAFVLVVVAIVLGLLFFSLV